MIQVTIEIFFTFRVEELGTKDRNIKLSTNNVLKATGVKEHIFVTDSARCDRVNLTFQIWEQNVAQFYVDKYR